MPRSKLKGVTGAAVAVLVGATLAGMATTAAAGPSSQVPAAKIQLTTDSGTLGQPVRVPPGGHGLATATCGPGKKLTGGGGATSAFDIFFTDSYGEGSTWTIRGTNTGTTTQSLVAFARCLP